MDPVPLNAVRAAAADGAAGTSGIAVAAPVADIAGAAADIAADARAAILADARAAARAWGHVAPAAPVFGLNPCDDLLVAIRILGILEMGLDLQHNPSLLQAHHV